MSNAAQAAPLLEGVFAIHKPAAITSAQVIRDVQHHFDPSKLFKPWIERAQANRDAESHNQRQKRKWRGRRVTSVKMGHGGTLDPMATGVLVLGLGSGTKELQYFSEKCTKSYETVLLFGASTDTYDVDGKVTARKPYEHIKKEDVEKTLAHFRGKIMQRPPIFSALRVQGKRLYEYAREGKEPPREILERPVEVMNLEMVEWHEGGTHEWNWPAVEADQSAKQAIEKALDLDGGNEVDASSKRKREQDIIDDVTNSSDPQPSKRQKSSSDTIDPNTAPEVTDEQGGTLAETSTIDTAGKGSPVDGSIGQQGVVETGERASNVEPCPAPACVLRMTVTSGFYVRSFCHDVGIAMGSLGTMAKLVRTRQGDFEVGTNVLQYDDLKKGEDVWGPKVKELLENWIARSEGNNPS